jgi:hypothetical protein
MRPSSRLEFFYPIRFIGGARRALALSPAMEAIELALYLARSSRRHNRVPGLDLCS